MGSLSDESWKQFANCRGMDPNMFFDLFEQSVEVQLEVDETCANCVVRSQCLEWAEAEGLEGGVFGRKYLDGKKKKKKNGKLVSV